MDMSGNQKAAFMDKNTSFNKHSWACYVPKRMLVRGQGTRNGKCCSKSREVVKRASQVAPVAVWAPANAGDTVSFLSPSMPDELSPCTTAMETAYRPGVAATEPTGHGPARTLEPQATNSHPAMACLQLESPCSLQQKPVPAPAAAGEKPVPGEDPEQP